MVSGVFERPLKHHEVLTLWCPHDVLPYWGEFFMSRYLIKAEDVGDVGTQQVRDTLLIFCLAGLCLCLPILIQFNNKLPDISGNERPLYPMEGGVHPREVPV